MPGAGYTQPTSADAMSSVASLSHVTLRYGDGPREVVALNDVTLSIAKGERLCVLGANGSGKSTLASVICGLLAPDEGTVSLLGREVFGADSVDIDGYRLARREIGLVFQNPDDQIVTSIVEEDVAFGPENLGLASDEIGVRVDRELRRVAMQDYARSDPSRLSGGQQQRVAIAGALAMEPRVLVLDEPGALLDVRGRRGIMRVMDTLHRDGVTIVHITHFVEEALAADRVVVMNHGHVMLEGTPEQVFSHGDDLGSLGLEMPFTARLSTALRDRGLDVPWTCDDDVLAEALADTLGPKQAHIDADGQAHEPQAAEPAPRTAIQVDHVSYTYHDTDGRNALDDVSFPVAQGASVAIVGQTGSGKSTLVRLICALEAPDQGRIVVNGIDTATRRNRRQLHGKVGYVMQHPERQLFAETVLDDVSYGPHNMGLTPEEVRSRCDHALALVGLVGKEEASPFQLSGGQQRLCAIAGILAMQPDTLVLDEPTAGLDPRGRAQLERILDDIHDHGVTIVRVTHSMNVAARAQQVLVLSQSRLLMQGAPQDVFCAANKQMLHDAGLGLPDALNWALRLGLSEEPLSMDALVDAVMHAARPTILEAPSDAKGVDVRGV